MNILILGGTGEARQLANRLVALGHAVTSSLAGRTQEPVLPQGAVRVGGFGGVDGLSQYLRTNAIEWLVDATHPYAGQISRNAVAASAQSGTRLLRLMRPAWEPRAGESWISVASAWEAAAGLPAQAHALVTTGHGGLAPFLARADCRLLVRTIEPPREPLPAHARLLQTRPPFSLQSEMTLMGSEKITHLVSKNSGGGQTVAKLEAADRLGVQVIMIARPHYDPAPEVTSVDAAMVALGITG